MSDTWGGSWGSSWGFSWGATAATTRRALSYGGHTPEDERRWIEAAQKLIELRQNLETAQNKPAAAQAALIREAETVIDRAEDATGLDAPVFIASFDDEPIRAQIEAVKAAVTGLMEQMHAEHMVRERRRRNNNFMMMQ